jgi:fucose 4-O-acetylase-like acetyltransferase
MRQQQFDLLKGIGMILVLIGHVSVPMVIFNDIYLFHMPLFFFASGCFFKLKQQSFKEYITKNAKRLLIPYLFFLSVFFFFNLFEAVVWPDANGISAAIKAKLIQFGIGIIGVQESLSFRTIWFLICLFEVTIIYWILAHVKNLWLRSALSLALFGVGYL